MEELLNYLLFKIVDNPEAIQLKKTENDQIIIFNIESDPKDLSRIIGKKGRTIKSLRILLYCYFLKNNINNKKIFLKVEESKL